jgi:uncharacterized RDD family membrane protein YckC
MDDMVPVIPQEARRYQGVTAGLVTRLTAGVIDALWVAAAVVAGYAGLNAFRFMLHPRSFEFVGFPFPVALLVASVLTIVYFTAAWSITGRTYGDHVMGLRVVGPHGRRVRLFVALVRAVLYVVLPIGLLWCAVSRSRRSVQDVLLRTSVIYDWTPRASPMATPGSSIPGEPPAAPAS